jgi:hypothetical protein
MHLMKLSKTLKAGQPYHAVAGSSITSAHHADPLNEAERLTICPPEGRAPAGFTPRPGMNCGRATSR